MNWLAFVFQTLNFIVMTSTSFMKGKKMGLILGAACLGSLLGGAAYICEGGAWNGVASNFYGALIAIVNFFFDKREKPISKWIIAAYALISIVINIWVAGFKFSIPALLIITAFFAYIFSTTSKNGAQYRVGFITNISLWCIYDVVTASFGSLPVHLLQWVSVIAGMLIHDRKKRT